MAFIVNDISVQTQHGLATVTLHETQGSQNRVVYVVVPLKTSPRQTQAARIKAARAAAKQACQTAAAAL
jgi:outer membrane usher protein FimD/PapC